MTVCLKATESCKTRSKQSVKAIRTFFWPNEAKMKGGGGWGWGGGGGREKKSTNQSKIVRERGRERSSLKIDKDQKLV